MAYSTGTATGVNDLMTKFRDFIEANGWTRDSDGTEGTGRRYHAHRSSVYINFRSFVNETPSVNVASSEANCTGIAFNVGTGYSGASAWYNQAGVPQGTSSLYMSAGITRATGTIPSYHFFAHNSGDSIFAVVEYAAGFYQFFCFGTLTKFGTYTGGQYFVGSRPGVDNTLLGGNVLTPSIGFFSTYTSSNSTAPAFVNATVDAQAGWKWAERQTNARPTGVRTVLDNLVRHLTTHAITPNTVNDLVVFSPVTAMVYRDTSNDYNASFRSPLGEIPKVFLCKIATIVPQAQVTLGSTAYRVFPFWHKDNSSDTPTSLGSGHSSYWGFAVAE